MISQSHRYNLLAEVQYTPWKLRDIVIIEDIIADVDINLYGYYSDTGDEFEINDGWLLEISEKNSLQNNINLSESKVLPLNANGFNRALKIDSNDKYFKIVKVFDYILQDEIII